MHTPLDLPGLAVKNQILITIIIPAYNNEEYTKRTLESILRQEYRPLKVILLDDASPNSLQGLANWFDASKDDEVAFIYYRNKYNLSSMDSYYLWPELIDTEWCMQLHHDDELTYPYFLSESVELILKHPSLVAVWANALTERTKTLMVRDTSEEWNILSGPKFLRYFLLKGHTSWSSTLYKWSLLKNFDFPKPPFLIDRATKSDTKLDMDEGFSTFYLLSQLGTAAVSGKVVSLRGEPASSYSRSAEWKTSSHSLFFIYMGCYLAEYNFKFSKEVRRLSKLSTYVKGIRLAEGFLLPNILLYYKMGFLSSVTLQYVLCLLFSACGFSKSAVKIGSILPYIPRFEYEHLLLFLLFVLCSPLILLRLAVILVRRFLTRALPEAVKTRLRSAFKV